jgi:hypothetical protein
VRAQFEGVDASEPRFMELVRELHKTIGPGVGMVDRLRDKLTGRSTG